MQDRGPGRVASVTMKVAAARHHFRRLQSALEETRDADHSEVYEAAIENVEAAFSQKLLEAKAFGGTIDDAAELYELFLGEQGLVSELAKALDPVLQLAESCRRVEGLYAMISHESERLRMASKFGASDYTISMADMNTLVDAVNFYTDNTREEDNDEQRTDQDTGRD